MPTMAAEHTDTTATIVAAQPDHGIAGNGKDYGTIKEGLAYILTPIVALAAKDSKQGTDVDSQPQSVFYNPIQQFNRDLSVLAVRAFGEEAVAAKRDRREVNLRDPATKGGRGKKRKRGDTDGAAVTNSGDQTVISAVTAEVQTNGEAFPAPESGDPKETISTILDIKKAKNDVDGDTIDMEESTRTAGQEIDKVLEISTTTNIEIPEALTEKVLNASTDTLKNTSNSDHKPTAAANHDATNDTSMTKSWKPTFTILDALSATGLRALRYAKEIPFVTSITANDLSKEATASIELSIQHNKLEDRVFPITNDARVHMYSIASQQSPKQPGGHVGKYDVIDLDPYGTAAPFFDAAVQSVTDGGLLCVTCTDSGVFASTGYLEKTYALYGGLPIKGPQSHEGGLRLVIHAIAASAARYGLAIEPLLSLSIDFYIRIFVRIRRSPAEVKFLAGKTMTVYNCDSGCGAWSTQLLARNRETNGKKGGTYYKHTLALGPSTTEHCEHCGFKTHMAGPMWAGPLHNTSFIQCILGLLPGLDKETYATVPRIEGMLSTALEETISTPLRHDIDTQPTSQGSPSSFARDNPVQIDHHPFFIIPSTLSKVLHCQTPNEDELRGALRYLGYRVTRSHTKPGSIRTNASWSVLWEVMREWVRQKSPVKEGAIKKGTAGWGIMQKSREHYRANLLKDEVKAALEKGENLEALKMGVEAALYRASKVQRMEKECVAGDVDVASAETTEKNMGQEKHMNGDEPTKPAKLKIVFDEKLGREPERKRLVRYQVNPRANWGPMNRAKA